MRLSHWTTSLLFLLSFSSSVVGQKKEEKLVRKTFEEYKTAILNDQGAVAAELVDSRTIAYYDRTLDLVRTADSITVASLSTMDRLMVFSIRHRAPKGEIQRYDGKGLFIFAVESGMVGKNSVSGNAIGEVIVDGNFAKGQFIAHGEETSFFFHFYKEGGLWKLDLTSLFPLSSKAFQKMAEDSGQEENSFIFGLLEMVSGSKPGREMWQPMTGTSGN